jgi:hypothetical protein
MQRPEPPDCPVIDREVGNLPLLANELLHEAGCPHALFPVDLDIIEDSGLQIP